MKLIATHEAVNFLSQAAPRPWVHRLLRWMAFDEGLSVYARSGKVQAYDSVGTFIIDLIQEAGETHGPKLDELIRKKFPAELANRLVGQDPHARIDDEPTIWSVSEEPRVLDIGFFLYASELDFDEGTLKAEWVPSRGEIAEVFFSNDDYFGTSLENADFEAEFSGLCFEFSKIEMLLPSAELRNSIGFLTDRPEVVRRTGRPPKWNWEGAMAFVISQAQLPDGLPTGPGSQARIEELINGWFNSEMDDAPSPSQIRHRASMIMKALEKSKRPKTS